jgi:hypothetical protein
MRMDYAPEMDAENDPDPISDLSARRRKERMPVEEGGGGQAEGFELSEQELIEHASHGDQQKPSRIIRDAGPEEDEESDAVYGEPDEEHYEE